MEKENVNNQKKIGLALSGGGYRAAAYHIGTLRTLHKLGILDNLDVISSVSGGSITAAYYALHKDNYQEFEINFIKKLHHGVLSVSLVNIVVLIFLLAGIITWFPGWLVMLFLTVIFFFQYKLLPLSFWIEKAYGKIFFEKATLLELPIRPLIAINSTNVATGKLFTFSQKKMAEYTYEGKSKKKIFNHEYFPITKAVMASSCVPFAFSPIRINHKYYAVPISEIRNEPLLIDGGLYDNQGAHKLSEKSSDYHTQFIIVSDAGNTILNTKWAFNIILMLKKTSDILMQRIRTLQSSNNMFSGVKDDVRYAYLGLTWSVNDQPVRSFVENIAAGKIATELLDYHQISKDDIAAIQNSNIEEYKLAKQRVIEKLKRNIVWDKLVATMPTNEEHNVAKNVGTNLLGLSDNKINALIKHSSWLAEVQIRLYLPYLINNNK